ncbi:MAG TPA: class I tRNA ligase family protein [Anaerolineales bacterium]|nr:class I tRNA ligase family protein [Anaerolineales bacterium]
MTFQKVPNIVDFVEQEHKLLDFWKSSDAFKKSRALRKGMPKWSFIDGPITANNPMGVHHGWGRTYKDLFNRFWTMRGRELRYQNGFDCQGLWVEVEVEKELAFESKKDIEEYGLDKFVLMCKQRVLRYAAVQTDQSIRLGYWMEWNDPEKLKGLAQQLAQDPMQVITYEGPAGTFTDTAEQVVGHLGLKELGGSYFTFSNENNYMIWKFLKKCWENGWLYRGADVMPWCPRCATAISQHEIVTDGYAELTHASVTLRFPLRGRENEYLLVWTTTPWTLSSNVAAAVGPELDYVKVKQGDDIYYLSKGTTKLLKGEFEVLEVLKGADMEGWTYDGPYDELEAAQQVGGRTDLKELVEDVELNAIDAHQVIMWDMVGEEEGTGIVHIAPGCGAEDFMLGKEHNFPMLAPLNEEGYFVEKFGFLSGKNVSEAAPLIFDDLKEKGLLYVVEDYTHRYPTCWRCKTELVFRLVDEWFINMGESYDKPREELTKEEKERSLRYQIMDVVDQIRWIPDFGHARELDWLRNMHDWMISKKRFWGLALPIWVCSDCGNFEVIGDEHELEARAVEGWDTFDGHTPHRPFVDAVKVECPDCGALKSRIPDVGNPWLDAGIVSFSTLRYRDEPDYWEKWYPANWISESFPGQFRNWFYSMLVMGTVIDDSPAFLQNFGYASLLAEDGREMHKSWGNSIEFNEAADKMGVDVMRWLYCAHKPENNLLFGYNRAEEVRRLFLLPLWNLYSFFATYASLDNWTPLEEGYDPATPEGATPTSDNPLDKWIIARINQVVKSVGKALENSDAYSSTLLLETFIDDFSNWYVRRSRRRFWKSEQDNDKNMAYATMYHVLLKLAKTLAPFVPFVTEEMYQNLVRTVREDAYDSIHHTDWPTVDEDALDQALVSDMDTARRVASLGLSARNTAGIKVRQPLAKAMVFNEKEIHELSDELAEIVTDELNVNGLEFVKNVNQLVSYRVLPNNRLLGPKFGSQFPDVRAALDALDGAVVNDKVSAGEVVTIVLDGEDVILTAEEVLVEVQPAEDLAVATDKGITVAIDTVLTDELRMMGLAREFVRRVQDVRKQADFNISDRISVLYQASPNLKAAVEAQSEYIQNEVLAVELGEGDVTSAEYFTGEALAFEDEEVRIGVTRKNKS